MPLDPSLHSDPSRSSSCAPGTSADRPWPRPSCGTASSAGRRGIGRVGGLLRDGAPAPTPGRDSHGQGGLDIAARIAAGILPRADSSGADLVVGMAREHVRDTRSSWTRRLCPHVHAQGACPPGGDVGARPPISRSTSGCARPTRAGRPVAARVVGLDDVADPVGQSRARVRGHRRRARRPRDAARRPTLAWRTTRQRPPTRRRTKERHALAATNETPLFGLSTTRSSARTPPCS